MSILVTTLGDSWSIIPELIGFTNPEIVDLYQHHADYSSLQTQRKEYNIPAVSEIWVITTCGERIASGLRHLQAWQQLRQLRLRIWQAEETDNLGNFQECLRMKELIMRGVLLARESAGAKPVLLSLAGGRKTMSADMQYAAMTFGCHALLHVIDEIPGELKKQVSELVPADLGSPFTGAFSNIFTPAVVGQYQQNPVLTLEQPDRHRICSANYPLELAPEDGTPLKVFLKDELTAAVDRRLRDAQHLLVNYSHNLLKGERKTNFLSLYHLPSHTIQCLQENKFGVVPSRKEQELAWLKALPKAELHCHLGGIASPAEIIAIAQTNRSRIVQHDAELRSWLKQWQAVIQSHDPARIRQRLKDQAPQDQARPLKALRHAVPSVPVPLCASAFILLFEHQPDLLDQVIYGDYRNEADFCQIGIAVYEELGDLQGTTLLQTEPALRKACEILLQKALAHQVLYLEIRCSPVNYIQGGLTERRVVQIIQDTCRRYWEQIQTNLIFIASRHGKMSDVYRHIELAQTLCDQEALEPQPPGPSLVGFDLAGNEKNRRAQDMREAFLPLMERCMKLTIHAGETDEARSIWEAAYHLNAERIGHGLKLYQDQALLKRFIDRRVTLEMCPSSNVQIVGFRDHYLPSTSQAEEYPLKDYLEKGLKVTVNTDNPGISRTDFTQELHRAARLSPGGLSQWELLKLIRNSFRGAFLPQAQANDLILKAEHRILEILNPDVH